MVISHQQKGRSYIQSSLGVLAGRLTKCVLAASYLFTLLPMGSAEAEVECSSDVFYSWVRAADDIQEGVPSSQAQPTAAGGAGAAGAATNTPGVNSHSKAQVVKFGTVARRGASEDIAKGALQQEVQRQKNRAADRCKRAHESTGECVTTKLSIKSSTLNSLSFSARAQAEKALMEECQMQQGRCLAVDASVATCKELAVGPVVESSGSAAPGAAAGAKGEASKGKDAKDAKAAKGAPAKKK